MKILATKVLAVCLLVAFLEHQIIGIDQETEEKAHQWTLDPNVELGHLEQAEISNGSYYEKNGPIRMSFKAFGKEFFATITPEKTIFANDAQMNVYGNNGIFSKSLPNEKHYGGHLDGQDNSTVVVGRFVKGAFDGVIFTSDDDYFIEPSILYYPKNPDFNAVVYRASNALGPYLKSATKTMVNYTRRTSRTIHSLKVRNTSSGSGLQCKVKVVMSDAGSDHGAAVSEAEYYVAAADSAFRSEDFDGDGRIGDVGFIITSLEIFEAGGPTQAVAADFSHACIGLLLNRKSPPKDSDQSTCRKLSSQKARICSSDSNRVAVSLESPANTRWPHRAIAERVVHQFGHLFGSSDDDEPLCQAKDVEDRYIMDPRFLAAEDPRSHKTHRLRFSECSRRSIGRFLGTSLARNCLAPIPAVTRGPGKISNMEVSNNELPGNWNEALAAQAAQKQKGNKKKNDKKEPPEDPDDEPNVKKKKIESTAAAKTMAVTKKDNGIQNGKTATKKTKKKGKSGSAAVERPWQILAATFVTFVAIRFKFFG